MLTYVATKNAGKLVEMRAIFAGTPIEPAVYAAYGDVAEGDEDYVVNARLKTDALARQLREAGIDAAVLADDSGIEVDALDGRPGVLSARYGGAGADWPARLARMLDEMDAVSDDARGARFVCAMVLRLPNGAELTGFGTVEGSIARAPYGSGGFGYDPIFWYPPRGCTFAELAAHEKDALSHRRRAADALLARVAELGLVRG